MIGDKIDGEIFNMEGITNLEIDKNQVKFFYKGDINRVIGKVNSLKIRDISIEEPSLEEIFMHYYE